ncbi:MAG: outer membrane protein transport protein [Kiritimatiellales bacterium]|nr:outer membrane protein transport protein [Kiritimatiellales bacterium]MCF7864414.1 outer membrane protein transport protein [Kiritimatiellales bacterium]
MGKQYGIGGFGGLTLLMAMAVVQGVLADGYRNPPPTAEGIAKSGANMVFVDDASSIFYNPANLVDLSGVSVVLDLTLARTESTYTSAYSGQKATSDADWNALPNLFIGAPVGDRGLAIGLGISTPFGQGSSYNQNDLVNIPAFAATNPPAIYEGQIALININPTMALKINEKLSFGIGLDVYYSQLTFKQYYPWASIAPLPDQNAKAEGDGYGIGGNAAVTWKFADKQKLAFSYRSEVKVEYEGDLTVSPTGVATPPQLAGSSFALDIIYPTVLGAGYGIELNDKIRIEANLEWLGWSANKSQTANLGSNGSLTIPQNWKDTFTFGVGGDWQLDENWVARAGYAFIESPIPDQTMAPILPDADRHALSLGLGYTTGNHTIDVSYTYSIYGSRKVSPATNPLFPGSYDIDSDLLGLTYSYSF